MSSLCLGTVTSGPTTSELCTFLRDALRRDGPGGLVRRYGDGLVLLKKTGMLFLRTM
jgi:hypothetical protein